MKECTFCKEETNQFPLVLQRTKGDSRVTVRICKECWSMFAYNLANLFSSTVTENMTKAEALTDNENAIQTGLLLEIIDQTNR